MQLKFQYISKVISIFFSLLFSIYYILINPAFIFEYYSDWIVFPGFLILGFLLDVTNKKQYEGLSVFHKVIDYTPILFY